MSWWYWWQIHLIIGKATDVSPISMHGFSTYIKPSTAETGDSGLDVACDSLVTRGVKGNIICLSNDVPSVGGLRRLNTCTWWSATNLGLSASNKILEPRFSHFELYEEIFLYYDTTHADRGGIAPSC
jgi:hypothetical protein